MSLAHDEDMREIDSGRIEPSPLARASVSPDGLILLDVRGGVLLASNSIGARIWQLIEQQHTVAEIARQLVADYDVPAARAEHDVTTFVAALADRGLISVERPC
ncbi:MAG TPA: PqqD family protein [Vicinamibacterales bacterium]|nr:PqqD family protein [Vicinamibacterales bacterium]